MNTDWSALSNLINDMWMYIEDDESRRSFDEELVYRRIEILDDLVSKHLLKI